MWTLLLDLSDKIIIFDIKLTSESANPIEKRFPFLVDSSPDSLDWTLDLSVKHDKAKHDNSTSAD